MKPIILILLCLFPGLNLWGQSLNGKIMNGLGEEGLPNVRVQVGGFSTVFSDQELGTFMLSLPGVRPGDKVYLDIYKENYAVINREATQPLLPSSPLDQVKIHMAPLDKRDEMALAFYKISVERNIDLTFEKAAKQFAEEANFSAIAQLHADKEQALKMVDSLSMRLTRFDPHFASEELTMAMQYYQEGNIEEALKLLDIRRILARIEARNGVISDLEEANQQDVFSLMKAADMALTELQFDKALAYYEAAVEADSTNVHHIDILCNFLYIQGQSKQLIAYGQMMKRASGEDEFNRGQGLVYIGLGYHWQNQALSAIPYFEESLAIFRKLSQKHPEHVDPSLVRTLNHLGSSFKRLDQYQESISAFEEALTIVRRLAKKNPNRFEPLLASILNNQGGNFFDLKRYDDLEKSINEALAIRRKLAKENPAAYEPLLAETLLNMASIHEHFISFSESLIIYEEVAKIFERLSDQNPQRFRPKLASTLGQMVYTYGILHRMEEAISTSEQALELYQQLATENPDQHLPNLANIYAGLGKIHGANNQYEEAISSYKKAFDIANNLSESNPQQLMFQANKLNYLHYIGIIHHKLFQFEKALSAFNKVLDGRRELSNISPQKYEPSVALILNDLGSLLGDMHRFSKSFEVFHEAMDIYEKFSQKNPQRFQIGLAMVSVRKGAIHLTHLLYQPSSEVYNQAMTGISAIDGFISQCPDIPYVQSLMEDANELKEILQAVDLKELGLIIPSHALRDTISRTDSLKQKISLQQELINIYTTALKQYPEGPGLRDSICKSLDSLAHWQLLAGDFEGVEASAEQCLSVSSDYAPIYRYLAPAFLRQSKFGQAKKVYKTWAKEPWPEKQYSSFQDVFLRDFERLKSLGATTKQIEKFQEWVQE
ncbi:MAG: tetratricopeptide repeat protein [Bacteroidota bacterium]